jgi:hypothetical protein
MLWLINATTTIGCSVEIADAMSAPYNTFVRFLPQIAFCEPLIERKPLRLSELRRVLLNLREQSRD